MNKKSKLGIPYMGSKRKLSKDIIDHILEQNPNTKYIYDLFGGGGAISLEALQRDQIEKVYYNDFNTGIVNLLKHIQTKGITSDFYDFVDREKFKEYKNKDCYYGGFIKSCYSFGNNQKSYLYGKKIEKQKELVHNIIVFKCNESIKQIEEKYNINIPLDILDYKTVNERRLSFCRFIKNITKDKKSELKNLQRIENLESLKNLEKIKNLKNLDISNKSYDEVVINTPINETIIYLDPPYENTEKYEKNDIDYEKLYEYVKNSPYKVYVSSYNAPLKSVKEFIHRSILSSAANNKVIEKLFVNR